MTARPLTSRRLTSRRLTSRRLTSLALAAALAAFGSIAAEGEPVCHTLESGDEVCTTTQQVWFHANGNAVGNTGAVSGAIPTFDTNEPATGGGGTYFGTSALHQTQSPFDPAESPTFEGTYEGAIDQLLVTMYLYPGQGTALSETTFRVDALLIVDGTEIARMDDKTVPMTAAAGGGQKIDFGWTRIAQRIIKSGLDLNGTHDVRVIMHGTGIGSSAAGFVYDTAEHPSGMLFNPAEELDKSISMRA